MVAAPLIGMFETTGDDRVFAPKGVVLLGLHKLKPVIGPFWRSTVIHGNCTGVTGVQFSLSLDDSSPQVYPIYI